MNPLRTLTLLLIMMCLLCTSTNLGCWKSVGQPYTVRHKAWELAQQGQYDEAIELCNEELKTNPDDPNLYYYRGFSFYCPETCV